MAVLHTDRPAGILFVFLDGVGLGPPGGENPLSTLDLPAFRQLAGGSAWIDQAPALRDPTHVFLPLDARLDVPGLPQSGTGQATLFSGVNCASLAGRHYGPFPPSATKPVLRAQSLFARLRAAGHPPDSLAFANAYPERFFAHAEKRDRWSVTTFCCRAAGVRLRTATDLAEGNALSADLTGARWHTHIDPGFQPIHEATAARNLLGLANSHRFTLFEYFLTDKAGHSRDPRMAASVLTSLDRFFSALLEAMPDDLLLVVSSDHGNIERLDVKTHTLHPVPLVAVGPSASVMAAADELTHVTPALLHLA